MHKAAYIIAAGMCKNAGFPGDMWNAVSEDPLFFARPANWKRGLRVATFRAPLYQPAPPAAQLVYKGVPYPSPALWYAVRMQESGDGKNMFGDKKYIGTGANRRLIYNSGGFGHQKLSFVQEYNDLHKLTPGMEGYMKTVAELTGDPVDAADDARFDDVSSYKIFNDVLKKYGDMYYKETGKMPDDTVYARIYNGGYKGRESTGAYDYAKNIQQLMDVYNPEKDRHADIIRKHGHFSVAQTLPGYQHKFNQRPVVAGYEDHTVAPNESGWKIFKNSGGGNWNAWNKAFTDGNPGKDMSRLKTGDVIKIPVRTVDGKDKFKLK